MATCAESNVMRWGQYPWAVVAIMKRVHFVHLECVSIANAAAFVSTAPIVEAPQPVVPCWVSLESQTFVVRRCRTVILWILLGAVFSGPLVIGKIQERIVWKSSKLDSKIQRVHAQTVAHPVLPVWFTKARNFVHKSA